MKFNSISIKSIDKAEWIKLSFFLSVIYTVNIQEKCGNLFLSFYKWYEIWRSIFIFLIFGFLNLLLSSESYVIFAWTHRFQTFFIAPFNCFHRHSWLFIIAENSLIALSVFHVLLGKRETHCFVEKGASYNYHSHKMKGSIHIRLKHRWSEVLKCVRIGEWAN